MIWSNNTNFNWDARCISIKKKIHFDMGRVFHCGVIVEGEWREKVSTHHQLFVLFAPNHQSISTIYFLMVWPYNHYKYKNSLNILSFDGIHMRYKQQQQQTFYGRKIFFVLWLRVEWILCLHIIQKDNHLL